MRNIRLSDTLASIALVFAAGAHANERFAPEIASETWLNSDPVSMESLRGNVVLVKFWTFACWNCKNVEPYVKRWHDRYKDQGFVVLAVHTPEFGFEKKLGNVRDYLHNNEIEYAVPIDNDYVTWNRYENRAWPAMYLIDKRGRIVYTHIGEGAYGITEARIRDLLKEDYSAG